MLLALSEKDLGAVDKKMASQWIVPVKTSFSTVNITQPIVLHPLKLIP